MGGPYALAALVAAMLAMASNPAYAIPEQVQTAAEAYVEHCEAMGASVQPTSSSRRSTSTAMARQIT